MTESHLLYAVDVAEGRVQVPPLVKLQCELSLEDALDPPDGWAFDAGRAEAAIQFLGLCPHIEGARFARTDPETGMRTRLHLEAWQRYFVGEVYGWWSPDGWSRRYKDAHLLIPKKNGKTLLGAGLCLFELTCGDEGAVVISAATKYDQAAIAWRVAGKMIRLMPELKDECRVTVGAIYHDATNGTYRAIGRDNSTIDGANPSFTLLDEAAAVQDRALVEELENQFAARPGGCMMRLTTAQAYDNTVFAADRARIKQQLEARERGSREFGLLYELKNSEEGLNPRLWPVVNPNWGVSKDPAWVADACEKVRRDPARLNMFLLKQCNVWTGVSEDQWLEAGLWERLPAWPGDDAPQLSRVGAVDASQSQDLSAVAFRHEMPQPGHYWWTWRFWAAENSLNEVPRPNREAVELLYREAADAGDLVMCPGSLVDWGQIEDYLREEWERWPYDTLGYDPYRATAPFLRMEEDGLPVVRVPQTMAHLLHATATAKGAIRDRRYHVFHTPFLTWQAKNTAAYVDKKDQELIRHFTGQPWRKNDAMLAMMMAERVADSTLEVGESQFAVVRMDGR